MAHSDGSDLDPWRRKRLLALQWELRKAYPHVLPADTLLFRCQKCSSIYPLTHFSRNSERRYGIRAECRHCRRAERPQERHEPSPEVTAKRCTRCRNVLPTEDFYLNRTQPDGYHMVCRGCARKRRNQYSDRRTEEEVAARQRDWTLRLCAELGIDYPGYDILQCRHCKEVKHADQFVHDWSYASRRKPVCLECHTLEENG